jgi:hypothetical protein
MCEGRSYRNEYEPLKACPDVYGTYYVNSAHICFTSVRSACRAVLEEASGDIGGACLPSRLSRVRISSPAFFVSIIPLQAGERPLQRKRPVIRSARGSLCFGDEFVQRHPAIHLVHILPRPTRPLAAIVGNILLPGIQHPAGNLGVTRSQKTQHPALWCPTSCRKFGCHKVAHRQHPAIGDGTSCLPATRPPVLGNAPSCLHAAITPCPSSNRTSCFLQAGTPCPSLPCLSTPFPFLLPAPLGLVG